MASIGKPPTKLFGVPPPGYVGGIGRGAVGFTTRSDIGPAKAVPTREDRYATQRGASAAALTMSGLAPVNASREEDLSESNYDAFSGYGGSLFDASTPYDAEDREADLIYDQIDARMEERRAAYKARRAVADDKERQVKRPKIQEQFADVKRQLGALSEEDWWNIPEPADLSKRNKRTGNTRTEYYTPLPDSVIASSLASTQRVNTLDATLSGIETPAAPTPSPSDLTKLGQARYKVLGINLDKMSDSVSGQTVVNPRDFLTDLRSVSVLNEAEVSDVKRGRTLMKSVITTNPRHAPGWICAARLEKSSGRISAARKVIMKGCEACPDSQDVWLEASRMHPPAEARAILANAVSALPTSVKIWMEAAKLEEDDKSKRAVLRRALEFIPGSVAIWKAAIVLEEPDDARVLLAYAVECVPQSVDMWLALARLETYDNARKILNRARKAIKTDPSIWIMAAQLEEANGQVDKLDQIIQRAVTSLVAQNVVIDREQWLREAEASEKSGSVLTCQAIVRTTMGIGVEEQDRRATWTADVQAKVAAGSIETARAIMAQTLIAFPNKVSLWWDAAQLEKHHGTHKSLMSVLRDAVTHCPDSEVLWLMSAKELWLANDVNAARETLNMAFEANPNSEEIWLAAAKMESENGEHARARELLKRARKRAPGARVWMKSAKTERETGDRQSEREILREALDEFPNFWKLWAMLMQNQQDTGDVEGARQTARAALRACSDSVELWIMMARLDASTISIAKARADLEAARKHLPGQDRLWLEAVRIEETGLQATATAAERQPATMLMSKALQECPTSGILWAHAIEMESRPKRRAKSYDALVKCVDNPCVAVAVSRLFWQDRKVKKAKNWFERAVTADPDYGDAWAYFYKFACQYFDEEQQEKLLQRCSEADPRHGEKWTQVAKALGNERLQARDICKKLAEKLPAGFV